MAGSGRVPIAPRARARRPTPLPADPAPGLEGVLVDALAGCTDGPGVGPMLARVARAWLRGQGLDAATVGVNREGGAWTVVVALPSGPARVRTIRVSVA